MVYTASQKKNSCDDEKAKQSPFLKDNLRQSKCATTNHQSKLNRANSFIDYACWVPFGWGKTVQLRPFFHLRLLQPSFKQLEFLGFQQEKPVNSCLWTRFNISDSTKFCARERTELPRNTFASCEFLVVPETRLFDKTLAQNLITPSQRGVF